MIGPEQLDINLLAKIFIRVSDLEKNLKAIFENNSLSQSLINTETILDALRKFNELEKFEAYSLLNFNDKTAGSRTEIQMKLQEAISECRVLLNSIPVTDNMEIGMITRAGNQEFKLAIARANSQLVIGVKDIVINEEIELLNKAKIKFLSKIFKEINTSLFTDNQRELMSLYEEYNLYLNSVKIGTKIGEILESSWLRFYFAIDYALTALFKTASADYIEKELKKIKLERALFEAYIIKEENVIKSEYRILTNNRTKLDEFKTEIEQIYTTNGFASDYNGELYKWTPMTILENKVYASLEAPLTDIVKSNTKLKWLCGLYIPATNKIYTRSIIPGEILQSSYNVIDGALFNDKWYSEYEDALAEIRDYLNKPSISYVKARYIWNEEDNLFVRSGWGLIVDESIVSSIPKDSLEFKLKFNCTAVLASDDVDHAIDPTLSITTDFTIPYAKDELEKKITGVPGTENIYKFLSKITLADANCKAALFQLKDGYESKVISGFVSDDMVLRIVAPNKANYINWNIRIVN